MEINNITCAGFVLYNPTLNSIVLVETPKGHLSFPKGKFEKKKDGLRSLDSFFQCALRELKEETQFTDYKISTVLPTDEDQIFLENNILYYPAVITEVTPDSLNCVNIPNDEIQSVKWYTLDEIKQLEAYYFKGLRKKIAMDFFHKLENKLINFNNEVHICDTEHIAVMDAKREKFVSKKLSYFLRHHLDKIPGGSDSEGFVEISSLLSMIDFDGITRQEIESVTKTSDKQRYKIVGSKIRANQGHSIESGKMLDADKLLTKLVEPREYCVHGTSRKFIKSIVKKGLNKANRTHIHFACQPDAISGFRGSSDAFIHIDMEKAMLNGIEFYISDNGVILSTGPISSDYFSKIEYPQK